MTMSLSVVDPSTVEIGQSLPPHGPHTITTHLPGWEAVEAARRRDPSIFTRVKSFYPRLVIFGLQAKLCESVARKISLPEGYGCAMFLSPDVLESNRVHAVSAARKDNRLEASELRHHVVDIGGVRLYLVGFPRAKTAGSIFQWQYGGLGISSRVAEALLPHVNSLVHVGEFPDGASYPEPTYFPEGASHAALRERIAGLIMRACASEHQKAVGADDVYLYPTGMGAINRLHEAIASRRAGPVVVFGSVFVHTFTLLEETEGGMKHYGRASDADLDDFEKYLGGGGECAYVFTEFPSNPIMVSVDLMRLRRMADKYNFFIVADDTCASFANIDLLSAADVVLTSLTKAFSGYADVMGGSMVLNPNSSRAYPVLKQDISSRFHNALFEADAACLLANNKDFLERSVIHNRNANALASYFHGLAMDPTNPIARVWYPPYSPGSNYLKEFQRKPTADYPAPGYGCLLSVDFRTLEQLAVFVDAMNFFQGPHLGAHLTLVNPYNYVSYGDEDGAIYAAYGLKQEQIRISVGLEDQEALLQRFADAISKVVAKMAA
ncbi:cystathionine gamma-synthase [Xylaria intraflava]|nr:cystathionine gamma-synthase [Xylaria intraflava]